MLWGQRTMLTFMVPYVGHVGQCGHYGRQCHWWMVACSQTEDRSTIMEDNVARYTEHVGQCYNLVKVTMVPYVDDGQYCHVLEVCWTILSSRALCPVYVYVRYVGHVCDLRLMFHMFRVISLGDFLDLEKCVRVSLIIR
jgi:hypothetical protein